MNKIIIAAAVAMALSGCTTGSLDGGPALEPIPGSITYGGQPRTKLTKAPIGSVVPHEFRNQFSQRVEEQYIIQPDRSLKLVSRRIYRGVLADD